MKKFIVLLAALLCMNAFHAAAQMTDTQVVEYVKTAMDAGKSEAQIGKELLAKGVTREQAERIKNSYADEAANYSSVTSKALDGRLATRGASGMNLSGGQFSYELEDSTASEEQNLPRLYDEDGNPLTPEDLAAMGFATAAEQESGPKIFGHDIFNSRNLSFEPNENAATPENYKLGPGDEVIIEIWGYNEAIINEVISPEGRISISQIGPVQLGGLTINEASEKIRKLLAAKYAGLDGAKSSVSVTLGQIRTIMVNVMGEVAVPGTYRLSSFSTVFNALYRAGGVTSTGSLRAVKVVRGGEQIASVDVYGYILDGKTDTDIRLQEGDVVIVPPYENLVEITGNVKRPMKYEMKDGETLGTLLSYAGGFSSSAYRDDMSVVRLTGEEKEIFTVKQENYQDYELCDGDFVTVGASLDRFSNMVELRGYVFRPGMYQLGDEIATVKQLVKFAGGPTEDAFLPRAIIMREKPDLTVETVAIDLGGILSGAADDVLLRKNDVLVVSGIHELEDRGTLTINGMVAKPGEFVYTDNTTIEDLILRAGGLLDGASTARVDISRRVMDSNSTESTDTLGISYSFPIKDGFAIDGGEDFLLMPYDVVSVRRSPGYREQTFVDVSGAVTFTGQYQLLSKSERISDVIKRAGGLTDQAYAKGARVVRVNDNNDSRALERLIMTGRDSLQIDVRTDAYNVAIDLEKALANPGSVYDVVLKSGDRIIIPEYSGTVRVIGEVMFPNAVTYVDGKSLKYYVNAAGGYNTNAKRSKAYIVYMNGSAARGGSAGAKIEPGCTIVVPAKPEREGLSVGELASITSAGSSLASVIAVLTNLFL